MRNILFGLCLAMLFAFASANPPPALGKPYKEVSPSCQPDKEFVLNVEKAYTHRANTDCASVFLGKPDKEFISFSCSATPDRIGIYSKANNPIFSTAFKKVAKFARHEVTLIDFERSLKEHKVVGNTEQARPSSIEVVLSFENNSAKAQDR